jgi:hypothetical protein
MSIILAGQSHFCILQSGVYHDELSGEAFGAVVQSTITGLILARRGAEGEAGQ